MIKIFRKIRKTLVSQGNVTKYLAYAIGEIVLVVIGILIALQVNNWNASKKLRQEEQVYLTSLHTEFSTNLHLINKDIAKSEKLIGSLGKLLTLFDGKQLQKTPEKDVSIALGESLRYEIIYTPNTGVLSDIISSGNLSKLRNDTLRQQIATFENALELIKNQEEGAINFRTKLADHVVQTGSLRKIFSAIGKEDEELLITTNEDAKEIFNSITFENNIILYQAILGTTQQGYYVPLRKNIELIIATIASEIEN